MKKLVTLTILAVLFSCRSDNDESANSKNFLIGKWKMQNNLVISGTDKTTVLNEYLPDDCKKKSTYEYTADGKYIMDDYNSVGNDCVNSSSTRDYNYNANDKTIKVGNVTVNILELTNSKFVLLTPDNYDYDGDGVKDYVKYIYYK